MQPRPTRRPRTRAAALPAALLLLLTGALLAGCTTGGGSTPSTSPAAELLATSAQLRVGPLQEVLPKLARAAKQRNATLVVPGGTYTVTQSVALPAGTRIRLEATATLTGNLPGAALVVLASDTAFSGGTLQNTSADSSFDVAFAQRAAHVTITGTTFRGNATNAVYLAAAGLRDIEIADSRFQHVVYGVLLNPPAQDARSITVRGNRFTETCGDAVEFNAVTDGTAQRVRDVVVAGNHMSGACGDGESAGFGVGLAGVSGFEVRGNTIEDARNEAIHLEDGTTRGTVRDNLISGGGHGDRPAIALYRTTSEVVVTTNRVRDFSGGGIAVRWDSLGSAKSITIEDNDLRSISGEGITVSGGSGTGPFTVRNNLLDGIGGNGIAVLGSHEHSSVVDNSLRGVKGEPIVQYLRGSGTTEVEGNGIG